MRLHPADERPRNAGITGGMTHLDERLKLPVLCRVFVIVQRGSQCDRWLAFVALRTQTQINAEDGPLPRDPRENLGNSLRKANEVFAVGDGILRRLRRCVAI